jgi:hypothetical protein
MKYKITTFGNGGEAVMGFVPRESYEYFMKKKINLRDFATSEDQSSTIPDQYKPFKNGAWYECDSVVHNNNVEMHYNSEFVVEDETGSTVWESNLDIVELVDAGCEVDDEIEKFASDFPSGNVLFIGKTFEKGTFFTGVIDTKDPFNPKKLKFTTVNINDWSMLEKVEYEGLEIENLFEGTTIKKDSYFKFEVSKSKDKFKPHDFDSNLLTPWYPRDSTPAREGLYEVEFANGRLGSALAYWNNSEFLEVAYYDPSMVSKHMKKTSIKHWMGLKTPC